MFIYIPIFFFIDRYTYLQCMKCYLSITVHFYFCETIHAPNTFTVQKIKIELGLLCTFIHL